MSELKGAYITAPEHVHRVARELAEGRSLAELEWLVRDAVKSGRAHDAKLWTMALVKRMREGGWICG